MEKINRWDCTIHFLQKNNKVLRSTFFLLAPAANMLRTSRFPIGCVKWQHAVFLESICEINSIKNSLPASTDGTLYSSTDLLYSPLLFSWTICFKSNSLSPFFLRQKYSKSNSSSLFSSSDKNFLSSNFLFCSF